MTPGFLNSLGGLRYWFGESNLIFFDYVVDPCFMLCVFDYIVNMAFKIAFFGRSNLRIGGGKFNG